MKVYKITEKKHLAWQKKEREKEEKKAKYTLEYYLEKDNQKKEKARGYYLSQKYGLSHIEYEKLFKKQNGVCDICGINIGSKKLAVDHNHTTGKNRGLLCVRCNLGLGYFKDDAEVLKLAIRYLEKHNIDTADTPIL